MNEQIFFANISRVQFYRLQASCFHSVSHTDKSSRLLPPTPLLYATKLTASDQNHSIAALNSVTNSLEHCVTKFQAVQVWLTVAYSPSGLTIALCCWDRSVLQTCILDSTWLDLAAVDTSSYKHSLPSTLPVHSELLPVCRGIQERPAGRRPD